MFSFIPFLALLPATYGAAAATWWKPTLSDTFLYDADRVPVDAPIVTTSIGLSLNKTVYIVDMENHNAAQIQNYKKNGKKVVCYISAGTWEPFRKDKLNFLSDCYCGKGISANSTGYCAKSDYSNRMNDPDSKDQWDEWWLDIRTPSCLANIQPIMTARIQAAKDKGCDAVDPDNMDVYANTVPRPGGKRVTPFDVDEKNQVDYLKWWAGVAHSKGMAIGLKNAGNLLAEDGVAGTYQADLVSNFDFNVIEACKQYKECNIYDSMLKAGKPQIRVEYFSNTTKCPTKEKGVTFSVYKNGNLNTLDINLDCTK